MITLGSVQQFSEEVPKDDQLKEIDGESLSASCDSYASHF